MLSNFTNHEIRMEKAGEIKSVCAEKSRTELTTMASMGIYAAARWTSSRPSHCISYGHHISSPILMFQHPDNEQKIGRRELILKTSEFALLGAIFHFSGTKPNYLGIQKNPPALALCPATNNCISTSEDVTDLTHYAPPWSYNPEGGRGKKKPVSREEAMDELLQAIKSTKPSKFTPRIIEKRDDYIRVEYESPIMGFVDDVEFWFPPGKKSIVQYRSASRLGNFNFDVNKKRIKALRLELEKKGWASEGTF